MLRAALFTIAGKQVFIIGVCINKQQHVPTVEYYPAINRNEPLTYTIR